MSHFEPAFFTRGVDRSIAGSGDSVKKLNERFLLSLLPLSIRVLDDVPVSIVAQYPTPGFQLLHLVFGEYFGQRLEIQRNSFPLEGEGENHPA